MPTTGGALIIMSPCQLVRTGLYASRGEVFACTVRNELVPHDKRFRADNIHHFGWS